MTFVEWLKTFFSGLRPWVTVKPWEQGVMVRTGKHRRLLPPGMYLKVPIIDQATVYPIRTRTCYAPLQTLRSRDGRTVTIGLIVRYRIDDLLKVLDSLHNPEFTLCHLAQGAVGELVPTMDAAALNASAITAVVEEKVRASQYGVGEFGVMLSDSADLSQRTFRLMSSDRWSNDAGEIDRLGRQA